MSDLLRVPAAPTATIRHLDDDARTLAALVCNELGRRPREGDEVLAGDGRLRVEQLEGNRITRKLVQLPADSGVPRAS